MTPNSRTPTTRSRPDPHYVSESSHDDARDQRTGRPDPVTPPPCESIPICGLYGQPVMAQNHRSHIPAHAIPRQIAAQPTEPTPQITGRACHDMRNTTDQPQTSQITPPNHRSRMPRHTQPGKSCINCSPQLPHCTRPTNRTAHTSHLVCRRIHHRSEVLSQKLVHEIPFPAGC